jgi:hypothetical protein
VTRTYRPIHPPIPVANATRISAKTADSVGALATLISLECIAQSNVVDDGITVGTVATVTTLTNLPAITANWLTAAGTAADFGTEVAAAVWQDAVAGDFTVANSIGKALYINNIAPGAAGGHFISGSNAGTTTVGALTVTGAFSINGVSDVAQTGDSFARIGAAGVSLTAVALAAATSDAVIAGAVWNAATATYGTAGTYGLLIETDLDATISSRLAAAGYTAPDNASVTAIKTQTDKLVFTVANKLDVNVLRVNGITVTGTGAPGSTWGPA